jgi:uncharacterized membrane protein
MSEPSASEPWWQRYLPGVVSRRLPADAGVPGDLVAVGGFLLLAVLVQFLAPSGAVFLRALVGLPLLFFVPGYAVVAALFPGRRRSAGRGREALARRLTTRRDRGIDSAERLALAFGTSVALLAPLGLVISVAGLPYTTGTVVATMSAFTAVVLVLAVVSRNRLPQTERYQIGGGGATGVRDGLFGEGGVDAVLNVALALVVMLSVVGVGYAVIVPNGGDSFTTATLVTADGQGGYVAADYPDTIGEDGAPLTVQLENSEGTTTSYTVVAELQRVEQSGDALTVLQETELTRMQATLSPGETWRQQHTVEPALGGENLRLIYHVYKGDAPENPSTETAYRYVTTWVDVPVSA